MGTFVSYIVSVKHSGVFTINIYEEELLNEINNKLNTNFELIKQNRLDELSFKKINGILKNYTGNWKL